MDLSKLEHVTLMRPEGLALGSASYSPTVMLNALLM
jgi:hypothetical protein